jgi:hypothetical protein
MSLDLQELFDTAGHDAPSSSVDLDRAVAGGRRLRARRRTAVGAVVMATAGAVAASVLLVSGLGTTSAAGDLRVGPAGGGGSASAVPAPSVEPSTIEVDLDPGALTAAQRARLMAVSLPDPAPGFPVRRWADPERISPTLGIGEASAWTRNWGLAVTPYRQVTGSDGQVSEVPTGPEVTLTVGYFPLPAHGKGLSGGRERLVADVDVAGGRGWVTTGSDKGSPTRHLYVAVGDLSVWIDGIDGVSTAELVALGNALRGLR